MHGAPRGGGRGGLSTFDALRHREFRLLWTGMFVGQISGPMQTLALGWLVVQLAVRDGTPQLASFYIGLIGLSRAGPGVVFGLLSGVLSDRIERRRLLLITQSGSATVAALLAGLTLSDRIGIPAIMALSFLSSAFGAMDGPNRFAMMPRLVPERDLLSAIGLTTSLVQTSSLLGPLIGGLLIGPIGVGGTLAVNALAYIPAIRALSLLRPQPVEQKGERIGVLASLGEGFAYVRREPILRWVIGLSILMGLFTRSLNPLMPAVANETFHVGALQLSWLLAANGLGSVFGTMTSASLGAVDRRGRVYVGSLLAVGTVMLVFSAQRELLMALLLLPLFGLFGHICSGLANSFLQMRAPDAMRGRTLAMYQIGGTSAAPLGTLALGSLGAVIGVSNALTIAGAIIVVVALYVVLRVHPLRDYRANQDTARVTGRHAHSSM